MKSGRIALGIIKVFTCIVGFGFAGLLIWSLSPSPDDELYALWGLGGVLIGLCVGLGWASGRKEMRIVFVMPLLVGILAFWVVVSNHGGFSPSDWRVSNFPLLLLLVLVIAGIWALSRAGVFNTEQEPETAPETSGFNVIEQLRELGSLKSEGLLTDEQFESKKQELLARL